MAWYETAAHYQIQCSHIKLIIAKSTVLRLLATPEEQALRERKICAAVRTILECIGEDPDREGLLQTPARYAQALLWMTKGYEDRLTGIRRVSSVV
jgi:GTP cyclohydrolase IA